MSKPDLELQLHDSVPGHYTFYTLQDIMIACWSKRGTGPAVQRLSELRKAIDDRCPNGVSVIHFIGDRAGLPTREARAGVAQLMERYKHQRICLAILIKGGGFWASAMRAAVTSTRLLVSGKFPMLVSDRVEEVVEWLPELHRRHTGTYIASDQLRSVLKRLESEI